MRALAAVAAVVVFAAPAAAQTYVSAGVGGAVTRSYSSSGSGYDYDGGNTEAISWMLRTGTSVTDRFGVELEFVRDGRVTIDINPIIYATAASGGLSLTDAGLSRQAAPAGGVVIAPISQLELRQRTTTWNAAAVVRKAISSRADLKFLGGVSFSRVVQNSRLFYDPRILVIRPETRTETVAYGAGPLVGVEASIAMTDHLALTPGVRLQSLGNDLASGIVLRPSVTLGWRF